MCHTKSHRGGVDPAAQKSPEHLASIGEAWATRPNVYRLPVGTAPARS